MMYVGYASASYGDEYIGPSATNDNPEQVVIRMTKCIRTDRFANRNVVS